MLLKKIINYYWIIGLLLYATFAYVAFRSTDFTLLYITSFITYLLYGMVITFVCNNKANFYTNKNLAFIVWIYSIIMVGVFHTLSYIIDGDTFLFSKVDAIFYYKYSLQYSELDTLTWFNKLKSLVNFDDWGAFFWIISMFKIIPSQQFVSLTYCIVGTVSSLLLFNIGRNLMPRRYAFLGALFFSIASFSIRTHSVLGKEAVMVFIIIASFNFFYNYLRTKSLLQLLFAFLIALAVMFYRVPVSLMILFSYVLTLVLTCSKRPIILIAILSFCALFIFLFGQKYILYSYDRYLRGGDIELIVERKNNFSMGGGLINHMADPLAALIGPFPSVISKNIINASGLLLRLLIAFPFLLGTYYAIKEKNKNIYPLLIFFFINAIGVAISVKGLELRLSYPHLAMAYLVGFWMLARFDYHKVHKQLSEKLFYASILCVLVICILWNVRGM